MVPRARLTHEAARLSLRASMAQQPVFKAFRIHERERRIVAGFEDLRLDDLTAGDVVIRVEYSGINYKDALAATGAGRILRRYPLVGGIDLAGRVETSADARYRAGDAVLVTGCSLSETLDGGYAQYARVPAEAVIPLPPGIDAARAMSLGTAGFTAALAIHRMEQNGQEPGGGPVLVTGATGGVGSIAIDLLSARGYEAVAVTGKRESVDYLRGLGASQVMLREELQLGSKPLESARWAGVIDNVGGPQLAGLMRSMKSNGNIASIGLAGGSDLHTSVMPFILRGVNLLGINSSATARPLRLKVWERLAGDLAPRHLDRIVTQTIGFEQLPRAFAPYIQGTVTGRTLVRIQTERT